MGHRSLCQDAGEIPEVTSAAILLPSDGMMVVIRNADKDISNQLSKINGRKSHDILLFPLLLNTTVS
jgi:hypothetical protein